MAFSFELRVVGNTNPMSQLARPVLVILAGWCAVLSLPSVAEPLADVDLSSLEFGNVIQGQKITKNFSIRNRGTSPLVVEKVEFSEPGMGIKVKQIVDPDDVVSAQITLDTSRLRRPVHGYATLYFNDPGNPQITVSLRGTVMPAVEFLPRPAIYLSQFEGERLSKSITLRNNQAHGFEIIGLAGSSHHFDYRHEVLEAGKEFTFTITSNPDTPPGEYRERLIIETSDPRYGRLQPEVNLLVKQDLFTSVEEINFGLVDLSVLENRPGFQDLLTQSVVIQRRQGEMRISGVRSSLDFLSVAVDPASSSNKFLVTSSLRLEDTPIGAFQGHLVLETDDKKHPEIVLPVGGEIKASKGK